MAKKITLKSGKKATLKEMSIDDFDKCMDFVDFETRMIDGVETTIIKNQFSVSTYWIRHGVEKSTDKYIKSLSKKWLNIPLLSRTHGQAASPSTIGKELKVFTARIDRESIKLKQVKPLAKFSGAVGNYHAFNIAMYKS